MKGGGYNSGAVGLTIAIIIILAVIAVMITLGLLVHFGILHTTDMASPTGRQPFTNPEPAKLNSKS